MKVKKEVKVPLASLKEFLCKAMEIAAEDPGYQNSIIPWVLNNGMQTLDYLWPEKGLDKDRHLC